MKSCFHCLIDRRFTIVKKYGWGSKEWTETYEQNWQNWTCLLPIGHKGEHVFSNFEITLNLEK